MKKVVAILCDDISLYAPCKLWYPFGESEGYISKLETNEAMDTNMYPLTPLYQDIDVTFKFGDQEITIFRFMEYKKHDKTEN